MFNLPPNDFPPYHQYTEERYYDSGLNRTSSTYYIDNEEIKRNTYILYNQLDVSDTYQLTIPILLSSHLGDGALYHTVLENIYSNLGLTERTDREEFQSIFASWGQRTSFNIWLLGRVLISADNIQDKLTAQQVASLMEEALHSQVEVDSFSTWAWGYLAAHHASNEQKYYACRSRMLECTNMLKKRSDEKDKDNVQWALVMNISAAGSFGDKETYNSLLQEFKEWTNKDTVAGAILTIPKEDFTSWALAIVRIAAAKIKDVDTYQSLQGPVIQAIENSESDGDKLLAEVNNWLSECIYN